MRERERSRPREERREGKALEKDVEARVTVK
jgi:hypothetical protein